jgi:hypothetical protein
VGVSLRAHHGRPVSSGQNDLEFSAGLSGVDLAGPEREKAVDRISRLLTFEAMAPGNVSAPQQLSAGCAMIVMTVIGGVIVAGLAWAGWDDYRRRRRGARHSVTAAFKRQAETDRQRISESAPGGDTTGGGGV